MFVTKTCLFVAQGWVFRYFMSSEVTYGVMFVDVEDSDDEWLASNKDGEDLDQSVVTLDTNGQKDTAGHREARRERPSKEGDNQVFANMDMGNILKEAMTEAVKMGIAVAQGQSNESEIGECVKRLTTIVETSENAKKSEESRKRKTNIFAAKHEQLLQTIHGI